MKTEPTPEDDFSMRLPPSLKDVAPAPLLSGQSDLVYRPALTKCIVLERRTLPTHPTTTCVTKVRLLPQTGRRHQLRVHTSLAGHAILGDRTYEPVTNNGRDLYDSRMCLHSQMLEIPLKDQQALRIEAPDPFLQLDR